MTSKSQKVFQIDFLCFLDGQKKIQKFEIELLATYIIHHMTSHRGEWNKAPQNPWKATVEDVLGSGMKDLDFTPGVDPLWVKADGDEEFDSTQGIFFALEDDFDSDSGFGGMDLNDNDEAEIWDDVALLTFSAVLQSMQEVAAAAKWKNFDERKRPKQYTGNHTLPVGKSSLSWTSYFASGNDCWSQKFTLNLTLHSDS